MVNVQEHEPWGLSEKDLNTPEYEWRNAAGVHRGTHNDLIPSVLSLARGNTSYSPRLLSRNQSLSGSILLLYVSMMIRICYSYFDDISSNSRCRLHITTAWLCRPIREGELTLQYHKSSHTNWLLGSLILDVVDLLLFHSCIGGHCRSYSTSVTLSEWVKSFLLTGFRCLLSWYCFTKKEENLNLNYMW